MTKRNRPRECFTEAGRAKKRYDTCAAAKRARRRALDDFENDPGEPYRCNTCGYFHLGHYPADPDARAAFRDRHR